MSTGIPETKSGRLICVARLKVTPGQESVIEEAICAARDYALSENEPGTHTYRTTRVIDQQGKPTGEYVVFVSLLFYVSSWFNINDLGLPLPLPSSVPLRPFLLDVSHIPQEEYAGKAGFLAHAGSPPIKAFMEKKGIVAEMVIQYAEEF
ncbi:hypothetical protein C8R43DRAFT_36713 [Mycena crocata]|nr:hypothetical protein C8R43DRAFT_36713 [Mycena crocata]